MGEELKMVEHIVEVFSLDYGWRVKVAFWMPNRRLRSWFLRRLPIRGECFIRHIEDGRTTDTTHAISWADDLKNLRFKCAGCDAEFDAYEDMVRS